jgi:hypothetical protein
VPCGALRGPVDDVVVDHDGVPVGCGVHIEFQHPTTDPEALSECLQGILWCDPRPTAMREVDRPIFRVADEIILSVTSAEVQTHQHPRQGAKKQRSST